MGRCLAWRPRSIERSLGVIAGRSSVVHWPRGSRTSPPRRRSRRACGQHGKRDPEPRGCREPPRVDGPPRYSKPVVAHWPPQESAATPIRLLDGRAVIDRNPRPLSGPFGFVSCLDGVRELDQAALLGPCSRRVGARRDHTTHSLVRAVRSNWSATRSVAICIDYSVLVGVNMAFPGALAPVWAKHHPFRVAHGQS